MNLLTLLYWGDDQGRKIYKQKLLRLVEQYRLTNQIKFINKCHNMPLAYKNF